MVEIHNPHDGSISSSFAGRCIVCKKTGEVRYLKDRNNSESGPYDRYCLYETKFGHVPIFLTSPNSKAEIIYRSFTNSESKRGRHFMDRKFLMSVLEKLMLSATIILGTYYAFINLFISLALILPTAIYLTLSYIISVDDEESSINEESESNALIGVFIMFVFFLFGIYLLGLVTVSLYLVSPVGIWLLLRPENPRASYLFNILKHIPGTGSGRDHLVNFELVWDGKANLNSKSSKYHLITSLLSLVALTFTMIISYFVIQISPALLEILQISEIVVIYIMIVFPFNLFVLMEFIKSMIIDHFMLYLELPSDVHNEQISRYIQQQDIDNFEVTIPRSMKVSRFFAFGNSKEIWKILCPICKSDVRTESSGTRDLSQCGNCNQVFHTPHLEMYISNMKKVGRSPCPVCKEPLDVSLHDFMLKEK